MKPEDIFKNAQQQNRIIMPGQENQAQPDPMQMLAMEIQRLGMGLAHTSRTNALIGKATDMAQLSLQLLFNVLVEKEVMTKEELETMYQERVIDRYQKMEEDTRAYAEKQMEEQQAADRGDLKAAAEQSEKADEAVVSDAKEVLDNVTPLIKKDD